MNLATSIQILELFAGGPGSGCRGSNCGRPSTGRYVQQSFVSPSTGARVTMVKPHEEQESRPQNPMRRRHPLRGQFDKLEKHFGSGNIKPGQHLRTWTSEAHDPNTGKGTTLFVHKYVDARTGKPSQVVVDEHNWQGYRWRYGAPTRFSFNNSGRAMGYVKKRYGLSIPLREWRG